MNLSRTRFITIALASVIFQSVPSQAEESLIPQEMVYIAHGRTVMGLDKDNPVGTKPLTPYQKRMNTPQSAAAFHDEGPAHEVFLDAYLMDRFEVSNKDFGAFIKMKGHPAPAYWDDPRLNTPQQPVSGVSWDDATAYCAYRNKRLPTEAEWEKAARGPNGNRYPWGNTFDPTKANYGKKQEASSPVDAYPEGVSYYGIYNMAGNVFEWVGDWYDPKYYDKREAVNPTGPAKAVWIGGTGTYVDRLTVGEKRVIRGGSWIAPEGTVRSTHRFWNHPLNNSYGVGLGFRCAKTASGEIDQHLRDHYVTANVEMGKERFSLAQEAVTRGLALDPTHHDLLELQKLIHLSMKKTRD